jgi:hypothetical protein
MQLTVKTLQQKAFKVEAEPSILVKDFKALIEEAGKSDHGGDYKAEAQKLIYQVFWRFANLLVNFNRAKSSRMKRKSKSTRLQKRASSF